MNSKGDFYISIIDNAVILEAYRNHADGSRTGWNESYRNLNAVFRRIKELHKEFFPE